MDRKTKQALFVVTHPAGPRGEPAKRGEKAVLQTPWAAGRSW
ncbi:MAG: hypothetical protein ACOX1P_02475 [Thermoguttaceae bacterium]